MTRILIIGAGVGGLVLARALALAGRDVTVFEASTAVGGQVAAHTVGGITLDRAAESFATRGGTVAALLGELGLGDDIVTPTPAPAWLHRADGTAVPLPGTSLLGVPANPLAADVRRAIGLPAALRASLDRVLPATRGAAATNLAELVTARMGRGVVDGLVAPITRGVHSREPQQLPVAVAHPRLLELLGSTGSLAAAVREIRASSPAGSQVAGIRGGMHRLASTLVDAAKSAGVEIRTDAPVTAFDTDGVTVHGVRHVGRTVLAAPPTGADGRSVTLVTLIVDAPTLDAAPRGTGLLVAAEAPGVQARALTHMTAKWAWVREAAPDRHVLRLSYDGHQPVADARADAELLLGTRFAAVDAAATVHLVRPSRVDDASLPRVGETASGTGLASVIAHAQRTADTLLAG